MKILHVIPSISSIRGGPSKAIIEMVSSLQNFGIDVSIVTTNDDGKYLLEVPINEWIVYKGVRIQFFPRYSPPINFIREYAFSFDFTTWFMNHVIEYDVIHIHAIFSYLSTAAMTIARRQNKAYIIRPLGQLCSWSLEQKNFKKLLYLKLIEKANIENSKFVHFTAKQEEEQATNLDLEFNSFVSPLGINPPQIITYSRQKLYDQYKIPDNIPVILLGASHLGNKYKSLCKKIVYSAKYSR